MPVSEAGGGFAFWHQFTRLGEAQIVLPALLAAAVWIAWRHGAGRAAAWWLVATAVAVLLTTASKVAFLGYGLGWQAIDFTGFSGHAMFAAAALPPLCRLTEGRLPSRWHGLGTAFGYLLAALVAWSRVEVGAHSPSEALSGFLLGSAASAVALTAGHFPRLVVWRGLPVLLLAWALLGVSAAPPSRTHGWVTQLALAMSGRTTPFHRGAWRRAPTTALRPPAPAPAWPP